MKIQLNLRKAAELGVGLTAIATLVLAGCGGGGGGGGGSAAAPVGVATQAVTVTPGKGVMLGAMVTIKDANSNKLGNASTASTGANQGIAIVNIPLSASPPFIVEVLCDTSCNYWDEKTQTMVSGVANAPLMDAVVPSIANPNIGVTAATNAAAQYVLANHGTPTVTGVMAANRTVRTLLNLPAGTDLLTPPTIIYNPSTQTAALAGSGVPDLLASISAKLAMAASGVSALQAISDYGTAWKNAALIPASGVILPSTINPQVASGVIPVTTIPNVASAVASAVAAVSGVQALLSDTTGAGTVNWYTNYGNFNASGIPATSAVLASVTTATANGANSYAVSGANKRLTGTTWVTDTDPWLDRVLTAAGWTLNTNSGTAVNNGDGTLNFTPTVGAASVERLMRMDLSGQPISCFGGSFGAGPGVPVSGVPGCVAASSVYPAGSAYYMASGVSSTDEYRLNGGTNAQPSLPVTDVTGTALTALPAANATFCVPFQYGMGGTVFQPIPGAAAGADNYSVFGSMSCSAADITTATAAPMAPWATVLGSNQSTGFTTVPTVALVKVSAANMLSAAWLNNNFIALLNGKVYPGMYNPKGSPSYSINDVNKIAANAELKANGYPVLP